MCQQNTRYKYTKFKKWVPLAWVTALVSTSIGLSSGCGSVSGAFLASNSTSSDYSGYLVVSSGATNGISLFNSSGGFVKLLSDYNNPLQVPYGVMADPSGLIYAVIDGVDRVDSINLATNEVNSPILHANLTAANVQGGAVDSDGNIYIVEGAATNTIEKFTSAGVRQGNPFIAATVGACVLSTPRNIAILGNGNIAVTSAANNRMNIYNSSGGCVSAITTAPFTANAPYAVAWDNVHSKIIVGFNTSSTIYATAVDGTGATQIFLNTTIISAPTAITVDSLGNLYVANTGLDTVEKLSFDGTTATRATSTPFIAPSTFVRDPYGVVVVP